MSDVSLFLGLINIGTALLLIVLSVPLAKRKIKMNYFYGVRIRQAFESEENWFTINEYGGKQLITWSMPMFLVGVICLLVPMDDLNNVVLLGVLGVGPMTLCILGALIRILIYTKKLQSQAHDERLRSNG